MMRFFDLTEVLSAHSHFWGQSIYFIFYILSLFVVFYKKGKRKKGMENVAFSMCIVFLVLYCPPLVNFFSLHFFKGHEFSRIAWGLLPVPIIAYGVVDFLDDAFILEKRHLQVCLILFLMCFLITPRTQSYFKIPDNIYKLPQEALDIENIIKSVGGKETVGTTFQSWGGLSYGPMDLVWYGLDSYGEYSYKMITDEELADVKYDILLTQKSFPKEEAATAGYEMIGETENVIVYKRNIKH